MNLLDKLNQETVSRIMSDLEDLYGFNTNSFVQGSGVKQLDTNVGMGVYFTLDDRPMYFATDGNFVHRSTDYKEAFSTFVEMLKEHHDHF
jgi:hypothetical protein